MNDLLIIEDENSLNSIIGRLLSQGFYQDFILSKDLILDIIHYANQNNMKLSNNTISKIMSTYDSIDYSLLINLENFNTIFPLKNNREILNLISTFKKEGKFAKIKLNKYLAKITLKYLKINRWFLSDNDLNFFINIIKN